MAYNMLKDADGHILEHSPATEKQNGLQGAALRFLYKTCENLRYDTDKMIKENTDGKMLGSSIRQNQIPYNMEMDIDRLCLENAARHFLESGTREDAFDVYFCFMEMFLGGYEQSRRMVELLSEFENNGSSLLMKHRDHYSHSVYVFLLGLAIYESNAAYRKVYQRFYEGQRKAGEEAAHHFLHYWGLASLFHDIGYPFELPFEQVASYFEVDKQKRAGKPFLAYRQLEDYIRIDEDLKRRLARLYAKDGRYRMQEVIFHDTNDLFAFDLANKLSETYCFSRESMRDILMRKPVHPDAFGNFMDHGYFSATILFKKLFEELNLEVDCATVDALTAIILHNSLYKFCVAFYKDAVNIPLKPELHPLAYMLMLCDELQVWDRTSYGRNSRTELHPMDCEFVFEGSVIYATYMFDQEEKHKMDEFDAEYQKAVSQERSKDGKKAEKPRLKAYGDFRSGDFEKDIARIIDIDTQKKSGDRICLQVETECRKRNNSRKRTYLSDSNFIHLYNFAVVLNARWGLLYSKDFEKYTRNDTEWERAKKENRIVEYAQQHEREFETEFEKLSLEYKLSNIAQAKGFAKLLNEIGCFYTDRSVDYDIVKEFTSDDIETMAPAEHYRWLERQYEMGWCGTGYTGETVTEDGRTKKKYEKLKGDERERKRQHFCMIPKDKWNMVVQDGVISQEEAEENYYNLPKGEQGKDKEPLECMLELLKLYDGLRIYRLDEKRAE